MPPTCRFLRMSTIVIRPILTRWIPAGRFRRTMDCRRIASVRASNCENKSLAGARRWSARNAAGEGHVAALEVPPEASLLYEQYCGALSVESAHVDDESVRACSWEEIKVVGPGPATYRERRNHILRREITAATGGAVARPRIVRGIASHRDEEQAINARRYVRIEAMRATGPISLAFFRHADGRWSIFPPNRETLTMQCYRLAE
ncbi:hypothetical protein OKW39_004540 [Paraburkholderia sp. MM6662-R1]